MSSKSAKKHPDLADPVRDTAGRIGDGVVAFDIDATLLVGVSRPALSGKAFTTLNPETDTTEGASTPPMSLIDLALVCCFHVLSMQKGTHMHVP